MLLVIFFLFFWKYFLNTVSYMIVGPGYGQTYVPLIIMKH
jgi:hypothetical protein